MHGREKAGNARVRKKKIVKKVLREFLRAPCTRSEIVCIMIYLIVRIGLLLLVSTICVSIRLNNVQLIKIAVFVQVFGINFKVSHLPVFLSTRLLFKYSFCEWDQTVANEIWHGKKEWLWILNILWISVSTFRQFWWQNQSKFSSSEVLMRSFFAWKRGKNKKNDKRWMFKICWIFSCFPLYISFLSCTRTDKWSIFGF